MSLLCSCAGTGEQCVPTDITQGERVEWTKTYSGYPADEYDLQYRFRGPGTGLDVDGTADGSGWDIEMTAVLTNPQPFNVVGTYHWQAWLTEIADATNTFIVEQGTISVLQGFIATETGDIDLRSDAQIMLDTIDAALLAFATSDVQEYEITTPAGSRRVKRSDKEQLSNLRKEYAIRVSLERTRNRIRNGGPVMKSICINVTEGC